MFGNIAFRASRRRGTRSHSGRWPNKKPRLPAKADTLRRFSFAGPNGTTYRQRRSTSPWRAGSAVAGHTHGVAGRGHHAGDRAPLRPGRIPAAAVASVLVPVVRRRHGNGLALVRHYHQRHWGIEARIGTARKRT